MDVRRLKDILETFDDDLKIKFLVGEVETDFKNIIEDEIENEFGDDETFLCIEFE
jgi:hypothetical protein